MNSEYAEIKRLEREIEQARIATEQMEAKNKQLESEIEQFKAELKRSEAELKRSEAENKHIATKNDQLTAENQSLRRTVAEAKDISPIQRAPLNRVKKLAANACMIVERLRSGWLLKFGRLERRFRSLGQIWQILIADDWALSDLFPPEAPKQQQQPRLPFRHPVLAPKCIGV